jgi:transposase
VTKEHGRHKDFLQKGNIVKRQDEIWSFFFKTNRKEFHLGDDNHAYTFDHQILTDGVSCIILLKRKGLVRVPKRKEHQEVYIHEAQIDNLQDKKIVGIDPGLNDLLYCVNSDQKDQVKYRYSQDTRRKETKVKKYRNILQGMKKQEVIQEKNINEWEQELVNFNKKSINFDTFLAYITKNNEIKETLTNFYQQYIFRKLKLGSYIKRQQTEARMINRFKSLFGTGNETIIAIGDFEQSQHRKFKEPIKGKGFRDLLRKAGYQVFLVDEFRTSCRCSSCEGVCSTFRECENPRPHREGIIKRHGLLKCETCNKLWNRDTNGASNIWKIAYNAIQGLERPEYLRRGRGLNQ